MVFLGSAQCEVGRRLLDAVIAEAGWRRARRTLVYVVTVNPRDRKSGPLSAPTVRFVTFRDFDRTLHSSYRLLVPDPMPAPGTTTPVPLQAVREGAMAVGGHLSGHGQ